MGKANKSASSGIAAALAAFALTPAAADGPEPPARIVRAAMAKLAWHEGDWVGEGWSATRDGKATFNVSESAHFRLDGLVLVVEGRGWGVGDNGEEIEGHKAFAVLSYDSGAGTYHFDAFVKEGYQTRSNPEVGENEYRWSYPAGPGAEMRFHARLVNGTEWVESGERCVEDQCAPVLEMRLKKRPAE